MSVFRKVGRPEGLTDNELPRERTVLPGIREYVGTMSVELALMVREQGDHNLADVLELAADMARRPFVAQT